MLETPEPRATAAPETLERFRELADAEPRAVVRELKAVGGDLRALRVALTGRDRGPELAAILAALPREEALRRVDQALQHTTLDRCPSLQGRCVCTSAARPSMRGPTSGTRARSSSGCGRNWLRERGYDATLVHNITDINDKIYEAARARRELAEQVTAWYLEDTAGFGLGMPDHLPKASEMVPQIVRFIEQLIEREYAYAVEGDVLPGRQGSSVRPAVRAAARPGRGAGAERAQGGRAGRLRLEGKQAGEDTLGLALGERRPGWHIECSVMAEELLGPVFEIHGGGLDLVFPHHENELAQSSALGHEFARIWTHNGMLRFTDEKMSKSLGNVVTIDEALEESGPETLLMMFLGAHWRKPMDFSQETLQQAAARAEGFREVPQPVGAGRGRRMGSPRRRPRRRLQHARGSRSCTAGAITSWSDAGWAFSGSASSPRPPTRRP